MQSDFRPHPISTFENNKVAQHLSSRATASLRLQGYHLPEQEFLVADMAHQLDRGEDLVR